MARLCANVLAQGFSNHETGECNPGLAALMRALGAPKRTVLRAIADLEAQGWIARRGGSGPNRAASYIFRHPERVPDVAPERVPRMAPQQVPDLTPEQVPDLTRTGATLSAPPIPPYKEQPNMNQIRHPKTPRQLLRGLARPSPHLSRIIPLGSDAAIEWDDWLAANGLPLLERIGRKAGAGMLEGWDMPFSRPPRAGVDEIEERIALKFVEWLKSRA
jgi:hypothetical protein